MCLILFAYKSLPGYPLIVAANRDEQFSRATQKAHFWQEQPALLAGKDLQAGGLWLGVTRTGRFAALTNYRDPNATTGSLSRGLIGKDFLLGDESAKDFLTRLLKSSKDYSGFNLLFGDCNSLHYYSNRNDLHFELKPGVYGLSNHLLDSPWPKITRGKQLLKNVIATAPHSKKGINTEDLITLLHDKTVAEDGELPKTGISLEYERILSPLFIQAPFYGTRSSSAITVSDEGMVKFHEQNYTEQGVRTDRSVVEFQLNAQECCD